VCSSTTCRSHNFAADGRDPESPLNKLLGSVMTIAWSASGAFSFISSFEAVQIGIVTLFPASPVYMVSFLGIYTSFPEPFPRIIQDGTAFPLWLLDSAVFTFLPYPASFTLPSRLMQSSLHKPANNPRRPRFDHNGFFPLTTFLLFALGFFSLSFL